jgi:hypothetical protein
MQGLVAEGWFLSVSIGKSNGFVISAFHEGEPEPEVVGSD